jgi:hypothetical protein
MFEAYKIISGKYDKAASPKFYLSIGSKTRGNIYKTDTARTRYDLRKYYFANRVINAWNSLPNYVVMSDTTNIFKKNLDSFWKDQDMIYNYQVEITGIGNRSMV